MTAPLSNIRIAPKVTDSLAQTGLLRRFLAFFFDRLFGAVLPERLPDRGCDHSS
jgi:hypothetical protein